MRSMDMFVTSLCSKILCGGKLVVFDLEMWSMVSCLSARGDIGRDELKMFPKEVKYRVMLVEQLGLGRKFVGEPRWRSS
jgi:hypothetical protein